MTNDDIPSASERKFLLLGVGAGIVGGIFPNLVVSSLMAMVDKTMPWWGLAVVFIIGVAGFVATICILVREIEKIK